MKCLPESIKAKFDHGLWTVTKTAKKFSSIAIDQSHEQLNKLIKGNGGAIGLTHSEEALTKWLTAAPVLSQMLQDFEAHLSSAPSFDDDDDFQHHEHSSSYQKEFQKDVKNLFDTICGYGNPFSIDHPNLLTLINQDACDPSVAQAMQNLQSNGTEQYEKYKREVLERGTKSMHDPIPKNNYPLISTPLKRTGLGNKTKIIKDNGELFGKMVAVLQSREISLQNFFCYEMHSYPPAILECGSLNLPGNKAGLKAGHQ